MLAPLGILARPEFPRHVHPSFSGESEAGRRGAAASMKHGLGNDARRRVP